MQAATTGDTVTIALLNSDGSAFTTTGYLWAEVHIERPDESKALVPNALVSIVTVTQPVNPCKAAQFATDPTMFPVGGQPNSPLNYEAYVWIGNANGTVTKFPAIIIPVYDSGG